MIGRPMRRSWSRSSANSSSKGGDKKEKEPEEPAEKYKAPSPGTRWRNRQFDRHEAEADPPGGGIP